MSDPTSAQPPAEASEAQASEAAVPAVPAPPAGAPVAAPAAVPARKGRGIGVFALILGLGAFLADVGIVAFAIGQVLNLAQNFDLGSLLAGLAGFVFLAFIGFWLGLFVAVLAIVLGIVAAVKNRGRIAGILGAILGLLVLASHLIVLAVVSGSSDLLSNLNGIGT